MKPNRNQTVTKTERLFGRSVSRLLSLSCQCAVQESNLQPTLLGRWLNGRVSGFSPLRTVRDLVRILRGEPKKGNRNRNATVTAVPGNAPARRIRIVYSAPQINPFSKEFRTGLEAAVREDQRRLEMRRWN